MSRTLTAAVLAAISGESVGRTVAVELLFDSAPVRVCGAPFDMTIGGNTFLGVGSLGAIQPVQETSDVQSTTLSVSLAGIPRDLVSTAMTETYQNRQATVYDVPLDPATEQPIADPVIVFRGLMDQMTVSLDASSAVVTVTITNRLADWERPSNLLFSDEAQQRLHAGDTGFKYAAAMETRQIVWPTAEWFRKHA